MLTTRASVAGWSCKPVYPTAPFPLPSLLTFPKQVSSVFSAFCFLFLSNSFRDLLHLPPSSETLAQADTLNPCGSACALTTEGIFNNKQSKRLSPEYTHKHTV